MPDNDPRTTTSPTSSPSASAASTRPRRLQLAVTATTPGDDLPGRARHLRERDRRGLRRPRRRQPRPRRRRLPDPGRLQRRRPAIHPGALEIRGNAVDENCDRKAEPFALLRSLVASNWQFGDTYSAAAPVDIRNAPKGARIALSCKGSGCSLKGTKRATVARDLAPLTSKRSFRRARLRAGTAITVDDHGLRSSSGAPTRSRWRATASSRRRDQVPGAGREGGRPC